MMFAAGRPWQLEGHLWSTTKNTMAVTVHYADGRTAARATRRASDTGHRHRRLVGRASTVVLNGESGNRARSGVGTVAPPFAVVPLTVPLFNESNVGSDLTLCCRQTEAFSDDIHLADELLAPSLGDVESHRSIALPQSFSSMILVALAVGELRLLRRESW
jgi:hypothetical protein